jgi:hypothetical protein
MLEFISEYWLTGLLIWCGTSILVSFGFGYLKSILDK